MVKKSDFEELVAPLGRKLVQRNTLYGTPNSEQILQVNRKGRTLLPVVNA